MIKRTLYFGNPAYLSTKLDQLIVRLPAVEKNDTLPEEFKKEATASIPIEDIGVVILDHQQISITQALLAKLLDNNAAVITCNGTHHPTGLLLNLESHLLQSQRFQAQLEATEPLKKQLWQQTVRAKILNQAALLRLRGFETENMERWADDVKSGDPENKEGRAAAWYWAHIFRNVKIPLPFDEPNTTNLLANFIREPAGPPPNQLLNYAYALLRATMARALVGSGLLPVMGIFHRNQYNAYCLADDIMEPYRPFADKLVLQLVEENGLAEDISPAMKKKLLVLPAVDVTLQGGETSPLMIAMQRTTASLAKCFMGETRKILYPILDEKQ